MQSKLKKTGKIVGAVLATTIVATSTMAGIGYAALHGNLTVADAKQYLNESERPSKVKSDVKYENPIDPYDGALNILIIGSDSRAGVKGSSSVDGMRSDTTMVAHISADRSRTEIISIPRDSWVDIPSCYINDNFTSKPATTKFNAAFAYGGQTGDVGAATACTIKTIENLTGIFIDGYTVVDFGGFEKIIDSLGGVEIDVKQSFSYSGLGGFSMEAGKQTMNGKTALKYSRVRKGAGLDGSDLSRITRQQDMVSGVLEKAKSKFTDIPTMYNFLNAVTSSLTISPEFSNITHVAGLGMSLKDLPKSATRFVKLPVADRGDGANVVWTNATYNVWESVKNDNPVDDIYIKKSNK